MYLLPREIHREIIQWLAPEEQQMTRLVDRYLAGLIQPRDVDLLKFGSRLGLLEYCEIGLARGGSKTQVCSTAAQNGHLEILKWARLQGCYWNIYTCYWAAGKGHLEVLKWLKSQECPWDAGVCSWAASNGHLEVLQWARSQGCPWDKDTCSHAAQNGHLEVLKWARERECPWNIYAVNMEKFPRHIQEYMIKLRG